MGRSSDETEDVRGEVGSKEPRNRPRRRPRIRPGGVMEYWSVGALLQVRIAAA
jgi:hypothetical protein